MPGTMTIELRDLRFHGYHGLYEEEKKTGNEFLVNVDVTFIPVPGIIEELADSISYTEVYNIVKHIIAQRTDLLETIAMKISENIKETFPQIIAVDISIQKQNPPISQFRGSTGVRYKKQF